MTTFLQIVILIAVAAVAILIVYLIDRVNSLQRLTRLLQPESTAPALEAASNGPFGDLYGQRLWAALAGIPTEGWDETSLELVRNRYTLVLRKHVEDLFYEGLMHGKGGSSHPPGPSRSIRTLRGTVESWIPADHAMTIYKAGLDTATAIPQQLSGIRSSLDSAVDGLFTAVSIKLGRPISETLIPVSEAERSAPPQSTGASVALPSEGSATGPTALPAPAVQPGTPATPLGRAGGAPGAPSAAIQALTGPAPAAPTPPAMAAVTSADPGAPERTAPAQPAAGPSLADVLSGGVDRKKMG
jgi:hypothetical protein